MPPGLPPAQRPAYPARMPRALALPCFLLLVVIAWATPIAPVHGQVRRCTSANGNIVYTDQRCDDIGASPVLAPLAPSGGGNTLRSMCARNVRDLAYGLENALQSGDANRIASLYDWTGVATASANRLMDRFDAMVARAFVDVQPVYAQALVNPIATPESASPGEAATDSTAPPATAPRRLVGLRVEQVLTDGHTPSHAVFGIIQRMGCWWIRG